MEILRRLTAVNEGPFPNDGLKAIYREIISASLSLEKPLSVAFLGPKATFTHLACLKHFGESAEYVPQINLSGVFDAVNRNAADFGVVPIENSSEGIVSNTLDMFVDYNLLICGEILVEVAHDLLNVTGDIDHVRKVYSHPHAIAQCRGWLERNLREVPVFDVESTARAAELAADDPAAAAIAGEAAAKIYGLKAIRKRIQDNTNNFTRFIILGKQASVPHGGRQDLDPLLRPGRGRGALPDAAAVREAQREPDQDRVAPRQDEGVGVPLLPRHVGPPHRPAGREGARGPQGAGPVHQDPRLLPPGDIKKRSYA